MHSPCTATDPAGPAGVQGPVIARSPHLRLRWTLHAALVSIALLLAAAGWSAWQGERRRAADAELINLAGAQRMLSQRVALLASQPPADNGSAFDAALARAQSDALRIEDLLGTQDAQRLADLPAALAAALQRWQSARERLWYRAHVLARSQIEGTPLRQTTAADRLRTEAEQTLLAAQDLVAQIQLAADAKSATALHGLGLVAALGALLLGGLAAAVVEPAARSVQRQHARLAGQAAHLQRLSLVARHTQNLVVIADAARRITWVNESFTRISGFTLAEAVGRKPAELLQTQATDAATVQRMRRAMDSGQGVRAELLNRSKAGLDYWLDVDIQPLHDAHGVLSGFIAVQTDITEQVIARQRLRALLDALPTGVVEEDASGAIIDANPTARQVLGLTMEQLLGRSSVDERWRTVRDDLSPYPGDQHPITRSLRDGVSVRGDSMGVLTPAGDQRWLLVNSEPLRNPAGALTGAVACFIDVTEQRAQRTLLQLALQAAAIGTWQWRLDVNERSWSAASCAMLGYSVEEFTPLLAHWRDRVHPEDRAPMESRLRLHLDDPATPYRSELRIAHRNGAWVWVQAFGSVVERDVTGRAQRMVGVHIDISERKRHEQQLQISAFSDALTGLPNRAALLRQLAALVERQRDPAAAAGHFGLLFLDFDRFKQVNDCLGHAAGDELLRQIAQRLQGALRSDDALSRASDTLSRSGGAMACTAARLGGDEFVVLLDPLAQADDATAVAERLLQVLAQPYQVLGQRVHSSASIGVITSAQGHDSPDSLLRDADTAMYEAKQGGRGRWVLFEPRMQQRVCDRASVEADLHSALERDELFVVYQPVLALDDRQGRHGCAGVEALVRWRHPERGVMPPMQFVPVAEESGLISALGLFVLRTACRQFMRWQLDLGERAPALLAVNLSIAQLRRADLVAQVQQTLADCAMPAAALQLEVTESLAAQDPLAQSRLRELKALGVKLALDDFGTGYSSLACLHQLPVDTVKIDRSFIAEAERSQYHRALIEATVRVARTLRMATVAEGVETAAQAELITALGCDRGQGYLYCKPLAADALTDWLAARPSPALARRQGPPLGEVLPFRPTVALGHSTICHRPALAQAQV